MKGFRKKRDKPNPRVKTEYTTFKKVACTKNAYLTCDLCVVNE